MRFPTADAAHRRGLSSVIVAGAALAAGLVPGRPSLAHEQCEICRYLTEGSVAGLAAAPGDDAAGGRKYAPDRQVDVTHIKLDVTPNFDRRTVAGTANLKFAPISKPLESLRLDGVNLDVKQVRSSHDVRNWSADRENVTVVFAKSVPVGEEAWVEIDYAAEPVAGLYFRTPEMGYPAEDEHCWTQGETHEARNWFPCFDYPNERASTELICRVPADMTVVSNGKLVSEKTSDDGDTKTFHWLQEKPHVSYLICFVAGKLEKLEGQHGDTPLGFYSQPSRAKYAENAFRDTADIMDFFEKEIGVDFPWDKYDQATIADFMFGGMENTTITTLTQRTVFDHEDDAAGAHRARGLNAHEMAHQWFGDYVTCKDWSHTWLNEGFATYYTHLYEGHKSGRDAMLYGLYEDAEGRRAVLAQSARDTRPIVYRDYKQPMEQFDFRAYPKGSWVLHMLRSQLGEKLFREAVHTYLERHALSSVETEDLREVFEELSGQPLDRFFDQWVYHGGAPALTITYRWLAKEKLAHVSIKQTQEVSDKVLLFELPAMLRFYVDGKPVDKSIKIDQAEQDFYFALKEEPTIVRFDPDYTLLAKVTFDVPEALLKAQLENEDDAMGRVLACVALGKEGKNGNVAALKERLQDDPFYGVREAAAKALQAIGTDDAVEALVDSVDQDDARVRRTVVEQLGRCYHDDANEKLLDVATDEDQLPGVAAAAIQALGRRSGDDATEAIEEALESRSFNNERMRAALAAIRDQRASDFADELVDLVSDDDHGLAADELGDALGALAAISQRGRRRDAAFEALREYLDHPRLAVRTAAISALGELRDPRARTLLEPFTAEGQHARVRAAARGAVEGLDRNAEQAPEEVGELRRELRELREKYDKLEKSLDEIKAKSKAEAKPDDDGKDDEESAGDDTDDAADDSADDAA